jgi:hypothetical protein
MRAPQAAVVHSELAERYVARMEAHLARLVEGHDPLGHLFGIERLARAARAERWEAQRESERGQQKA